MAHCRRRRSVLVASLALGSEDRLIVVGDVHGCAAPLRCLLSRLGVQDGVEQPQPPSARDVLVIAGDYVNKGPASFEVVRLCARIGALGVLGNHDRKLLKLVTRLRARGTIPKKHASSSLAHLARECPDDVFQYLSALPHVIRVPQRGVIVVHAGLIPDVAVEAQHPWDVTEMRNLLPSRPPLSGCGHACDGANAEGSHDDDSDDGDRGMARGTTSKWSATKEPSDGGCAWATQWFGPELVVFGHDARRRLQRHPFALGLDTGCVHGGELTAAVFPPVSCRPLSRSGDRSGDYELVSVAGYSSS